MKKLLKIGMIIFSGIILAYFAENPRETKKEELKKIEQRGWNYLNNDSFLDYWSETGRIYFGRADGFFDGTDGKKYFVHERIVEPVRIYEKQRIAPEFIALADYRQIN